MNKIQPIPLIKFQLTYTIGVGRHQHFSNTTVRDGFKLILPKQNHWHEEEKVGKEGEEAQYHMKIFLIKTVNCCPQRFAVCLLAASLKFHADPTTRFLLMAHRGAIIAEAWTVWSIFPNYYFVTVSNLTAPAEQVFIYFVSLFHTRKHQISITAEH